MQEKLGQLISELKTTTVIPPALEEAMRMVPRPSFLPPEKVCVCTFAFPLDLLMAFDIQMKAKPGF